MEAAAADTKSRYAMGRLTAAAPGRDRRGHVVRVIVEGRVIGSTTTDGAGRFLLEWPRGPSDERVALELLDPDGRVVESAPLVDADLVSPPVVSFSGKDVLGSRGAEKRVDSDDNFEADGDFPLCVTSSCQQVTLSWTAPNGSTVSVTSDGETVGEGLPAHGTLHTFARDSKRYTRRAWLPGDPDGRFSDLTVEVRRYPTLSLVVVVVEGATLRGGSEAVLGASISCPAGPAGLLVSVMTSDAEMVPRTEIRIPAGSNWATTRVRIGNKTGRVEMTAIAPDYTRDGVTVDVE